MTHPKGSYSLSPIDLIQSTHFNGERTGSGSASSQSVKSKNVSVNQTSHFETTGRTVNPLA